MSDEKSSSVPKIAGPVLVVLLIGAGLFLALRPNQPNSPGASGAASWDRKIIVLGDPGTSFRYWLNRPGVSEYADRDTPAVFEVPGGVLSVEIRHTGPAGSIDLKVQNQKGEAATTSLSKSNDFADLIITEKEILWSRDGKNISRLKL